MTRSPAVADRFYPGNSKKLSQTIETLFPTDNVNQKTNAFAVVSPHAGYIYSGQLAGKTLASITIPKTVILIGPNHHGHGAPIALSNIPWKTPLGEIPIDSRLTRALLSDSSLISEDELAHQYEHSLEVQLPFLQTLQPQLKIVPLVISSIDYPTCVEVAKSLSKAITLSQTDVLIVASSDMSHYKSRTIATKQDQLALDEILKMNPAGLFSTVQQRNISMCGMIPVTISLKAAMLLGATKSKIIGYTDSGEMSGDTSQVVGYAGIVIS